MTALIKRAEIAKRIARAVFYLFCASIAISTAWAHGKASGIVRERMDQMIVLKDAMKVLKSELSKSETYDRESVLRAAQEIENQSGEALVSKFPVGSTLHSEALPTVWSDPARFLTLAEEMQEQARALKIAVEANVPNVANRKGWFGSDATSEGEAMASPIDAFGAIADTCSECHRSYRVE